MAITRLAISNPAANSDILMHTAVRSAVASVIATNKGSVSANISVWIVPSGQDANSSAWMHIASAVTMDAGNSMETFRFPLVSSDKIYIRSTTANVSFSLNALYETNGTSNISVQSIAPASPQIGDVWIDSDDNKIYFWNGTAWVDAVSELPSQTANSGKYLTTNGSVVSWGTVDKSSIGLGNVENTALSTWAGSTNINTLGTLTNLTVTNPITGSITGNSGTVTNGVYTTGSYSNPSWITSLSETKVLPSQTGNSGKYLTTNGTITSWVNVAGATGGGTDAVFYENDQAITTNYTLTTGKNAMTAGPVTINSGITVTIPSGSVWSIV
jgi:hypothetical protein